MARLRSYEDSDGVRRVLGDAEEDDLELEDDEDDGVVYVHCTHTEVTTELIARGIVRGYFYILLISVLIAVSLGVLLGVFALLGEALDS